MVKKYLGTISLERSITARCIKGKYELWSGYVCTSLSVQEVKDYLDTTFVLANKPIVVGRYTLSGRELKALWNTMLAYLKGLDEPIATYTGALADAAFSEWEREQGIDRSKAQPIKDEL
jgi:hypothetical protein